MRRSLDYRRGVTPALVIWAAAISQALGAAQ